MKIGDLINVETLHEAGFDKVREVHISQGEDYFGDESFLIWILMDDALSDEELGLKFISSMRDWVYDRAWEFGEERIIPHINVRRQSEWPIGVVEDEA